MISVKAIGIQIPFVFMEIFVGEFLGVSLNKYALLVPKSTLAYLHVKISRGKLMETKGAQIEIHGENFTHAHHWISFGEPAPAVSSNLHTSI